MAGAPALEYIEEPVVLGHHAVIGAEAEGPFGERQRMVRAVLGAVGHELRDALRNVLLVQPAPYLGPVVVGAEVLEDEATHGAEFREIGLRQPLLTPRLRLGRLRRPRLPRRGALWLGGGQVFLVFEGLRPQLIHAGRGLEGDVDQLVKVLELAREQHVGMDPVLVCDLEADLAVCHAQGSPHPADAADRGVGIAVVAHFDELGVADGAEARLADVLGLFQGLLQGLRYVPAGAVSPLQKVLAQRDDLGQSDPVDQDPVHHLDLHREREETQHGEGEGVPLAAPDGDERGGPGLEGPLVRALARVMPRSARIFLAARRKAWSCEGPMRSFKLLS